MKKQQKSIRKNHFKAFSRVLFIFLMITLTLITLVSSAKPQQIIDSGCEIRFPAVTILKQNQDVKLHAHVINITLGSNNHLTNTSTTCYLHLYNTTSHLLEHNLTFDDNLLEWELSIDGANFSKVGEFAFYLECASVDSICAVSGGYEVSATGIELTIPRAIVYLGLLAIMIFLFLVTMAGIPLLPSRNEKSPEGELMGISHLKHVRTFLWGLAYMELMLICFLSSNIASAYLGTIMFSQLLFNVYYLMGLLLPIMFIIWFLYLLSRVFQDGELQRLLNHGIREGA